MNESYNIYSRIHTRPDLDPDKRSYGTAHSQQPRTIYSSGYSHHIRHHAGTRMEARKKKKRDVVLGLGPKNTGSRYWREKSGVVVCLRHPTTTTTTLHASYRVDSRWLGSVRDFVVSIVCCVSLLCSPSSDLYNNKTTDSVVLSMSRF